jgi:hypothetical protein
VAIRPPLLFWALLSGRRHAVERGGTSGSSTGSSGIGTRSVYFHAAPVLKSTIRWSAWSTPRARSRRRVRGFKVQNARLRYLEPAELGALLAAAGCDVAACPSSRAGT